MMKGSGLRAKLGLLLMLSLSIFGLSDFNDDLLGKREQLSHRTSSHYGLTDVQPSVEPEDDSISDLFPQHAQGFLPDAGTAANKLLLVLGLASRGRPPDDPLYLRYRVLRV